jgi:hypothetical protein
VYIAHYTWYVYIAHYTRYVYIAHYTRYVYIVYYTPKIGDCLLFSEFLPLMVAPKVKFQSFLLENIRVNITSAGMTT